MVDLTRALELLAMPKRGRGGRTALKDLGTPKGSDEKIQVFDGPYGLYVKQGKVNASLPEGKSAEQISLEEAVELLAAKLSTKKSSRKTTKSKTSSKSVKKASSKSTKKEPAKASSKSVSSKSRATTKSGRLRASAVKVIRAGKD